MPMLGDLDFEKLLHNISHGVMESRARSIAKAMEDTSPNRVIRVAQTISLGIRSRDIPTFHSQSLDLQDLILTSLASLGYLHSVTQVTEIITVAVDRRRHIFAWLAFFHRHYFTEPDGWDESKSPFARKLCMVLEFTQSLIAIIAKDAGPSDVSIFSTSFNIWTSGLGVEYDLPDDSTGRIILKTGSSVLVFFLANYHNLPFVRENSACMFSLLLAHLDEDARRLVTYSLQHAIAYQRLDLYLRYMNSFLENALAVDEFKEFGVAMRLVRMAKRVLRYRARSLFLGDDILRAHTCGRLIGAICDTLTRIALFYPACIEDILESGFPRLLRSQRITDEHDAEMPQVFSFHASFLISFLPYHRICSRARLVFGTSLPSNRDSAEKCMTYDSYASLYFTILQSSNALAKQLDKCGTCSDP
ncbi:hypothetical protein ONZ45_g9311 [Pleurotus djamor]|nr:hypothetical protein ONZ45_g9311 [Pleurotus djamor]